MLGVVNSDSHLTAGVAWQGDEPETGSTRIAVVDEISQARLHDRVHALFQGTGMDWRGATGLALPHPFGELTTAEQITSIGESRLPTAILSPGIPTDVIDMQMRAEYEI